MNLFIFGTSPINAINTLFIINVHCICVMTKLLNAALCHACTAYLHILYISIELRKLKIVFS